MNLIYDVTKTQEPSKVQDMTEIFMNREICSEEKSMKFYTYYLIISLVSKSEIIQDPGSSRSSCVKVLSVITLIVGL